MGNEPNGTPNGDQASTSSSSTTDGQAPVSQQPSEFEKIIAELRKENAAHRTKLATFEKAQADADAAKLTETERLQKQLAELQSEKEKAAQALRDRVIQYEILAQATKLGIIDPDAAVKLLDQSQLKLDDSGVPTNVDALLAKLIQDKPYLVSQAKPPAPTAGGSTNPSRSSSAPGSQLSWDAITKMTPDEYNSRRTEIQTWMQSNPPKRF
jgi:hypothetical protein